MSDHHSGAPIREVEELRRVALEAGITGTMSPESLGIELDSPDDFLARMKALEPPQRLIRMRRGRVAALAIGSIAAASALILGVIPLWPKSTAEASTPPILTFEFAAAKDIAYAPGKDSKPELQRLATVAAGAKRSVARGDVQHVVTDNWFASIEAGDSKTATVLIPQINETSLRTDGSFQLVERRGTPLSPDGRGLPEHGAWDKQPKTADEMHPPGTLDPVFAQNLPLQSSALRSALLEEADCSNDDPGTIRSNCLVQQIISLYSLYVIPPKLASALWKMLSEEDGLRLLGDVKDRAGRDGTGISLIPEDEFQTRFVLIISPRTGQLLGSENILIKTTPDLDVQAPAIISFRAILDSRFVRN